MRRLVRALFVGVVMITFTLRAASADAHTSFCFGSGQLVTSAGYSYITSLVPRTASFSMTIGGGSGTGGCFGIAPTGVTTLNANGFITGWCGHWVGNGTMNDGVHSAPISLILDGTKMTVTAGAVIAATTTPYGLTASVRAPGYGEFEVIPVPVVTGTTVSNSCSNWTATGFQASGWMKLP